ncbi:hypothetical protein JCM8097_002793 [Rhodosporidiobolus ruineniae]
MPTHPALQLSHSSSTYFVLTTSSSAPPPLSSLSLSPTAAHPALERLSYVGPVGPGLMEAEHVVALPHPAGRGEADEGEVRVVKGALRGLEGVQGVEIMRARDRVKR